MLKRGNIFWAQQIPRSGSEQRGTRPVIIVSHDSFNQAPNWQSINVVPVSTSTAQSRRRTTTVFLPTGAGGLSQDSFALCHQITRLDRAKLTQFIGTLDVTLLGQIDAALKAALQLS